MSGSSQQRQLARVIADMAGKTSDSPALAKQIAAYLVSGRQTHNLNKILRQVSDIRRASGVLDVNVSSAFPLSSKLKSEVEAIMRKEYPKVSRVIIHEEVNPRLLSGIIIKTHDKLLDETARSKLKQLSKAIA